MSRVLTVGHGTLGQEELASLLTEAGVERVVDVRRSPGSRRSPHVGRKRLVAWLPEEGIGYRWEPRLGGRRSRASGSPHTALTDAAMQGYVDHLDTSEAADALAELLGETSERRTALMCAESDWRRCHRRLIADELVLARDTDVHHLRHDGGLEPHVASATARVVAGRVIHDGGEPGLGLDV
jgi:uncharacterized protein (DUF488 family)